MQGRQGRHQESPSVKSDVDTCTCSSREEITDRVLAEVPTVQISEDVKAMRVSITKEAQDGIQELLRGKLKLALPGGPKPVDQGAC